jgi:hypothetical protein
MKQRKKDSDQKSSNATTSGGWSYLYLAGTTPNEGAKLERRGRENGMNEPRGWVYIGGLGRWHLPGLSLSLRLGPPFP